jgi:hypothetical protein
MEGVMPAKNKIATLFERSKGMVDNGNLWGNKTDEQGSELLKCHNFLTTRDGKLKKLPCREVVREYGSAVKNVITSPTRLLVGSGIDIYDFDSGTRIAGSIVEDSNVVSSTGDRILFAESPAGTYLWLMNEDVDFKDWDITGIVPGPSDGKIYESVGEHTFSLWFNGIVFTALDNYLSYSRKFSYGQFNTANNRLRLSGKHLYSDNLPAGIVSFTDQSVDCFSGNGPHDFAYRSFQVKAIPNTIAKGFINETETIVFCCFDGIYLIQDMVPVKVVHIERLEQKLISPKSSSLTQRGYVVGGDVGIWYDFASKALSSQDSFVSISDRLGDVYSFDGTDVSVVGVEQDENQVAVMQTPYDDLGWVGIKKIRSLYVTGEFSGVIRVILRSNTKENYSYTEPEMGFCRTFKVHVPSNFSGTKISVEVVSLSGVCMIDSIKATVIPKITRTT